MRTTINLPDELLARLKKEALDAGSTLTALIEDSLRERLARQRPEVSGGRRVQLPTYGTGGLAPGIDLDDSAGLLEAMESHSDTP